MEKEQIKTEDDKEDDEYVNPIKESRKDARIDRVVKKSGVERNDDKSELVLAVKGRDRKKNQKYI